MSRKEWYKVVSEIQDHLPNVPPLRCPRCGEKAIDFHYTGDPKTRIGFMVVWCGNCLHGIHLSRVHIPENAHMTVFGSKSEEEKRIPNFTHVLGD